MYRTDELFQGDPFPAYARLRSECPVAEVEGPMGTHMWLVTRYEDARATLNDERLAKDMRLAPQWMRDLGLVVGDEGPIGRNMLHSDPPDHSRLRRLVVKAFTRRRVEGLRPRIQEITDDLLDAMPSETDLLDSLAFPLPITVICELLGVPIADRDDFRTWTRQSLVTLDTPEKIEERQRGSKALRSYLADHIVVVRDRVDPLADPDRQPDLLSALIVAADKQDRLSQRELLGMAQLLLIAGHETTLNLIGNGMLALFRHPEQLQLLRNRPELLPSAIEELLRYHGPGEVTTPRFATEDVEIGGAVIPRGSVVMVAVASAHRDPDRFADPDRLDITREDTGHLAFGHGIHFCLGAPLARLEAEVAFGTLLRRFPGISLACPPEDLKWRTGSPNIIRGLESLPIRR